MRNGKKSIQNRFISTSYKYLQITKIYIAVKPDTNRSFAHTISFYKPHSEEEAQYFFRVNPTLFDVDQEQLMWLFTTLQKFMQSFADKYLGDQA